MASLIGLECFKRPSLAGKETLGRTRYSDCSPPFTWWHLLPWASSVYNSTATKLGSMKTFCPAGLSVGLSV